MKTDQEPHITLRYSPWLALVVVAIGYFMNVLDSTVVNVAVPSIITGLHMSTDGVLWVINGYLLPYALLLLVAGRLGDLYGHRNVFFAGLLAFTVASVLCGVAHTPGELIAARVLEGVGAAAASPQAVAITSAIFPPARRGLAFGTLAGVVGVASVAGPALGGVVTNYLGWRWIFFLNVPFGLIGLAGTFVFVPATRNAVRQRLRPGTVVLSTLGLFAILFALIEGQRFGWGRLWGVLTIPSLLVVGPILLVVVALVERAGAESLLPRALFNRRNYALMVWAATALSFGIFGAQLVMTIYLQLAVHASPLRTGLLQAPMWLAATLVSPVGGRLSDQIGRRPVLVCAFGLFGLGVAVAGVMARAGLSWALFITPLVFAGLGAGFIFGPMPATAMAEVEPHMAGGASAMIETARQVGGAIATAVVGAILLSIGHPGPASGVALFVTAAVLGVAAVSCLLIRATPHVAVPERRGERHQDALA